MRSILLAAFTALLLIPASAQQAKDPEKIDKVCSFIVHEWGTFTTVAGSDGASLDWRPLSGPSDLPSFVYTRDSGSKGLRYGSVQCSVCKHFTCPGDCCKSGTANCKCKMCLVGSVRMETPVIYFYAEKEMKVSVKVDFPQGAVTEWYPRAKGTEKGIDWGAIQVLASTKEEFPREAGDSHYYPARETDANAIRVCPVNGGRSEHEKFLFYRGVGSFGLPIRAALSGDRVTVTNPGEAIPRIVLFENRGGKVGYRIHDGLKGEVSLERPALDGSIAGLEKILLTMLEMEHLYPREAAAMVKTWRDSWFEEGLRIFYPLPRAATDAILPLHLDPVPDQLVRVMIGRMEFITPEQEGVIGALVGKLGDESLDVRNRAEKELEKFGRFAEPVMRQVLAKTSDPEVVSRIKKLLRIR